MSAGAHLSPLDFKTFDEEFGRVVTLLDTRKLLDGRGCAWVGDGIGADFFIRFAAQHPGEHPDVLVCMADESSPVITTERSPPPNVGFPIIVLEGSRGHLSQQENSLVNWLREGKNQVQVFGFENSEPELNTLLFREVGEKVRHILYSSGNARVTGPLLRQSGQPAWTCFWPAASLFLLYAFLSFWKKRRLGIALGLRSAPYIVCGTGVVIGCVLETLLCPREELKPGTESFNFAKQWYLTDVKHRDIPNYLALAGYNRPLVNWDVNEADYQDYILCPVLETGMKPELSWRKTLWSFFYPKIRKANSPEEAASILVRLLREEIEIQDRSEDAFDWEWIWHNRVASPAGFQLLYVAVLRSVGVGARINSQGDAEILSDGKWRNAPPPPRLILQ